MTQYVHTSIQITTSSVLGLMFKRKVLIRDDNIKPKAINFNTKASLIISRSTTTLHNLTLPFPRHYLQDRIELTLIFAFTISDYNT